MIPSYVITYNPLHTGRRGHIHTQRHIRPIVPGTVRSHTRVDEALGNPVLCKETLVSREPASGTQVLVEVLEPFLRDIKVIIHQTVAGVPGVGKEYPDLAVLPFAQAAAVLPLYPDAMGPFLHEAGIINREHRAWYGSSG